MFSVVTICIITGHLLLGVVCWTLSEDVTCRSLDLTVGLDVHDGNLNKENPETRPGLHSLLDSPVTYFSHNWRCLSVRNVMWDIFRFNTCKITYDVTSWQWRQFMTLWYLCLGLPVWIIVYFFNRRVLVIMWEKESDTRCLLRSTVLKLVQKIQKTRLRSAKRWLTLWQMS